MNDPEKLTIRNFLNYSLDHYRDKIALSYSDDKPLTYAELKIAISEVQSLLICSGISKGDRVALLSQNMPNWGIAFFAITSMGAIAVPILPDFSNDETKNIIKHSGSRAIFVSQRLLSKLEEINVPELNIRVLLDDLSVISTKAELKGIPIPKGIPARTALVDVQEDDLASIIYTSGTTGRSKGVMLTHKNIVFNAKKVLTIQWVRSEDIFLSVLPLSHSYENTLGLILPIMQGASVYYLRKPPSSSILLPALKEVRPTIMLTVPIIIEKIFRAQVHAKFTGHLITRILYHFSLFRKILHRLAGKKLLEVFGDRLIFYGIGGAKLDPVVERFLREARFPYAIGYGLTETAPMLAGSNPQQTVFQSTGPVMEGVELRIDHPDPLTGLGEILAKGENVMKGYYKEPDLTREVFTPDGWFRTGDLGCFDKKGNLSIRGRLKNMILTASGENIYPEDIESLINNFNYVVESIVIEKKGKLVALVHFDHEALQQQFEDMAEEARLYILEKLNSLQEELIAYVNERVNKYSRLQSIEIMQAPFEKTPTLKIKRYLYYQ